MTSTDEKGGSLFSDTAYHTAIDTLDKVDRVAFREQAVVLAELVCRLSSERVAPEHKPPEEVAENLREAGFETELRAIDIWPYD